MAGRPGRSGGSNAVPVDIHLARGTYRPARHAAALSRPEPRAVSEADRRRVLQGLAPEARRIASGLLTEYGDWDSAALFTLRQYALSCAKVAEAPDDAERRRELRANLALLRELDLARK